MVCRVIINVVNDLLSIGCYRWVFDFVDGIKYQEGLTMLRVAAMNIDAVDA